MEWFLIVLIIVAIIFLVSAIVVLVYYYLKKVEPTGKPIALNFAVPWATPEHTVFTEKKCENGPEGKFRITLIPKDIDIMKKELKVEEYQIIVGRDRRVEIGNLGFGAERNTFIYEPKSPFHLPSSIKKTFLGKAMVEDLKEKSILDSVLDSQSQIEAINTKILLNYPTTIGTATFELHKNLSDVIKSTVVKKEEKEKPKHVGYGRVETV